MEVRIPKSLWSSTDRVTRKKRHSILCCPPTCPGQCVFSKIKLRAGNRVIKKWWESATILVFARLAIRGKHPQFRQRWTDLLKHDKHISARRYIPVIDTLFPRDNKHYFRDLRGRLILYAEINEFVVQNGRKPILYIYRTTWLKLVPMFLYLSGNVASQSDILLARKT